MRKDDIKDLEILCKHLSDKLNVKVEFVEDGMPSTDGNKITLPTNINKSILFELLATLLHENFHIKYTDLNFINSDNFPSPIVQEVTNVLEDIRVDGYAINKYPAAVGLYSLLSDYAIQSNREALDKESMPWKVIRHLMLKARTNAECPEYGYDDTAKQIISKLGLDEYIKKSQTTKYTYELQPLAQELIKKLLDYVEDQKQKQSAGQPTDFDTSNMTGLGNQQMQVQKIQMHEKRMQDLANEMQKIRGEFFNSAEALRRAQQAFASAKSTINKKQKELAESDQSGNFQLSDKLQEQIDRAQEKLDTEKTQQLKQAELAAAAAKQKDAHLSAMYKKMDEKRQRMVEVLDQIEKNPSSMAHALGIQQEVEMAGFGTIGARDLLKPVVAFTDLELEKTLDEKLREFFVERREERQIDEDGTRLNRRKLASLYTTSANMFTERHQVDDQTDLIFLLDNSGSMCGQKGSMLVTAVTTLMNSLKRVVFDENLPLSMAVYTFNNTTECIKEFDEELDIQRIASRYRTDGGTTMLPAINKMAEVFDQKGRSERRLLMVLTDAEVSYHEIQVLSNQAKTEMKTVYIGIGADMRNESVRKLFMETNINTEKEILDVLSKVIMD